MDMLALYICVLELKNEKKEISKFKVFLHNA